MLEKVKQVENVREWWEETNMMILRVGQDVLSITAGWRPPGDKETWWEETNMMILRVGQEVLSITAGRRPPGDKETRGQDYKEKHKLDSKQVSN